MRSSVRQEPGKGPGAQESDGHGQQVGEHAERRVVDREIGPEVKQIEDQGKSRCPGPKDPKAPAASAITQGKIAAETKT